MYYIYIYISVYRYTYIFILEKYLSSFQRLYQIYFWNISIFISNLKFYFKSMIKVLKRREIFVILNKLWALILHILSNIIVILQVIIIRPLYAFILIHMYYIYVYMYTYMRIHYIYIYVYIYVLSICLSIYLSIYLSLYLALKYLKS